MRSWIAVVAFSGLLLHSGVASADIITIEPDDFAAGTDLSHVGLGVTLWTIRLTSDKTFTYSPVYSAVDPDCGVDPTVCAATTGTHVFSPLDTGIDSGRSYQSSRTVARCFSNPPAGCTFEPDGVAMLLEFDTAADFVEMGSAFNFDASYFVAFDAQFNRLSTTVGAFTDHIPGGYSKPVTTISAPAGDIKYLLAGSIEGGVGLDALRYHAVPEPSTLAYGLMGLVGVWRAGRRYRRN